MDVRVPLHFRPSKQVLLHAAREFERGGIQVPRRHRAKIDNLGRWLSCSMDQCKADPTKPRIPWLDRGKRQCRGDGGIYSVASSVQYGDTGLCRAANLRHDNAATSLSSRLREDPVLGEMGRWDVGHLILQPAESSGRIIGDNAPW